MAKTWRCWDRKNHENSWLPQEIWWFVPRNLMVFLRTFDGFSHENSWFSQENWCFLSAQKILGTVMVSKGNHPQMMCGWFVSAMFTLVNYYKIQPDLMVFPRKNQFNWTQNRTKIVIKHQIWWFSPKETDKNHQRLGWMTTHLYSKQVRVMFRLSTINPMIFAMTSLP
jgi:hypothetical protein